MADFPKPPFLTMKKFILAALLTAVFLLASSARSMAAAPGWTEDYEKAVEKAKTEKKNLLLDFTGSDWCGFCMALDKEVFETPKFKTWAHKNVVLVTVDFPHNKQQTAKVKAQNADLKTKFMNSGGYPTIVVIDPDGKVLVRKTGYSPGSGPQAYLDALNPGAVTAAN